jgi:hypothetical protein
MNRKIGGPQSRFDGEDEGPYLYWDITDDPALSLTIPT